jgi:hypothetical protein
MLYSYSYDKDGYKMSQTYKQREKISAIDKKITKHYTAVLCSSL